MEKFVKTQCLLSFGTNRVLTRFPCVIISFSRLSLCFWMWEKAQNSDKNSKTVNGIEYLHPQNPSVCVSVKGSNSR